jgi:hypothetical protein
MNAPAQNIYGSVRHCRDHGIKKTVHDIPFGPDHIPRTLLGPVVEAHGLRPESHRGLWLYRRVIKCQHTSERSGVQSIARGTETIHTQIILVEPPEHNEFVSILDQRIQSPIQRLAPALIRACRTQEHPRLRSPRISDALRREGERKHRRGRVLEGVKRDFRRVAPVGQ